MYFGNITKGDIYQPSVGGLDLLSHRQIMGMQYSWRNSYFLDINQFYYNPYFANYWWWDNRWRFDNYWRSLPPRYVPPDPRIRKKVKSPVYRGQPRNTRVIAPSNTAGSTIKVPRRRSNPNTRTYVQPTRKNIRNVSTPVQNSGRHFKDQ
jgi:hypothetical protein